MNTKISSMIMIVIVVSFMMANCVEQGREQGRLLLFVRNGEEDVPVDLPQDATVADLYNAVVIDQGIGFGTLSIGDRQLNEQSDLKEPLCDLGISQESTVGFRPLTQWTINEGNFHRPIFLVNVAIHKSGQAEDDFESYEKLLMWKGLQLESLNILFEEVEYKFGEIKVFYRDIEPGLNFGNEYQNETKVSGTCQPGQVPVYLWLSFKNIIKPTSYNQHDNIPGLLSERFE